MLEQVGAGSRGSLAAESLDRLTRLASRLLSAPVALVSLVEADRQVFASQTGLAEPWATRGETPLSHSFCQHAVTSGQPLIVTDARKDPLLRGNSAISDLGVVAYAGIPLIVGRQCVGSFCVIDATPRDWSEDDLALLRDLAASAMTELELRRAMDERAIAAADLEESLARYQALAQHVPGGAVFLFDAELRYLVAEGPSIGRLTSGVDPVGRTPTEVFTGDSSDDAERIHTDALRGASGAFVATMADGRSYEVTVTPIDSDRSAAAGVTLALDVTDRAHLEAEQGALLEIAQAVAEGADREALLQLVVERVATLFDAVGAAIFQFERPGRATLVSSAPILAPDLLSDPQIELSPTTAVGRVARTGGPVVVADYGDADDPLVRALRALGAVGGAAAPIGLRRPWGALGIGGGNPELLTHETASRLARFASLVGTSIENVEAWEALTRDATTDELTGLPNRRTFDARLDEEVARSRRHGRGVALVLLDVDRFKAINDRHGHLVGDDVLSTLGGIVAREVRGGEIAARIGGEEFAVLMPETAVGEASALAERLRIAIAGARFGPAGSATVSLGVAVLEDGEDASTLLGRADVALYRAKADGRDTVAVWAAD